MAGKVKVVFALAVLVFLFSSAAFASLTGKWKCNDGGMYYLRQVGNTVFWLGEKAPMSSPWCNVAYGTYASGKLNLRWADVPKCPAQGAGTLVLSVDSTEKNMQRSGGTGSGFGGTVWTKQ